MTPDKKLLLPESVANFTQKLARISRETRKHAKSKNTLNFLGKKKVRSINPNRDTPSNRMIPS
jgi:hypothetical protein